VVYDREGAAHVLRVLEDLDIATAPALEAEIARLDGAELIIVDLSRCDYMDSTGFALFDRIRKALGDRFRVVAGSASRVVRVLRLMTLDRVLPIAASLEEAELLARNPNARLG